MTIIKTDVDLNKMDVFGHLVADLSDGFGSVAMEAYSDFFDTKTPLELQVSVIGDWIQLLQEMKEFVEGKRKEETIQ